MTRIELPDAQDVEAILRNDLFDKRLEVIKKMERMSSQFEDDGNPFLIRMPTSGVSQQVLWREDGTVLYQSDHNLITDAGFDLLCDVLGNNTQPSDLTHIGIGSGTTAAAVGDTTLGSQLARVAGVYAHTTGTKVFTLTSTFPAGTGTGTVTEAGCFNAANAGTLFNRVVFGAVTKGGADSFQQTFTFTFS